jgi:hypothetical protein
MATREQTLDRALILAAGRATRLGGRNKLLVEAAGIPVADYHAKALAGYETTAVVRYEERQQVREAAPWLHSIIGDNRGGGPVGALTAYFESDYYRRNEPLLVIYGDTLIDEIPERPGSWVGVAAAPTRIWDFHDGIEWTRGTPAALVCVGLYRFDRPDILEGIAHQLTERATLQGKEETHMAEALRYYADQRRLPAQRVHGWRDAGDDEALARIEREKS